MNKRKNEEGYFEIPNAQLDPNSVFHWLSGYSSRAILMGHATRGSEL